MWNYGEAQILSRMCNQVNAFGTNEQDQFIVHRENNEKQGIFKTWAIPVIPFLDKRDIKVLDALWPQITKLTEKMSFQEALRHLSCVTERKTKNLAQQAIQTLSDWQTQVVKQPMRLAASLERARLYTWILDQRLNDFFYKETLACNLSTRISQLVNRLKLAFGLFNPFYHLEALVDDPHWLGVEQAESKGLTGKLDGAALLLPAALKKWVVTSALNWNGLSWPMIYDYTTEAMTDHHCKKILVNLARLVEAPPQHIIFAANAINWIPRRVGGKKNDRLPTNDALAQLEVIVTLPDSGHDDIVAVLSEMNARIRFLNWFPLVEKEDNFNGLRWSYASVCDTSELLFQTLVEHQEVWKNNFTDTFNNVLQPQLLNLDAASAKGRFLLHLILVEKRLKSEYFFGLNDNWRAKTVRIVTQRQNNISAVPNPTRIVQPQSLVGGKPFGLSLAGAVVGQQKVADGFVVSTTAVEDFLRHSSSMWNLIHQLDTTHEIRLKKILAKKIEQSILSQKMPKWTQDLILAGLKQQSKWRTWAVRSSSLEEGEARGVYKTLLKVSICKCFEAFKKCVASYYSQKAVLFRKTRNESDMPRFAVLFQPYLQSEGGVAEIRNNSNSVLERNVSVGKTAAKVTAAETTVQQWDGPMYAPQPIAEVVDCLERLHTIFGPNQIEWARKNGSITIFQMELLPATPLLIEAQKQPVKARYVKIKSLSHLSYVAKSLAHNAEALALNIDSLVNMGTFQEKLFEIIIMFGKRVVEIHMDRRISPSCHIANICRLFGINLVTPP